MAVTVSPGLNFIINTAVVGALDADIGNAYLALYSATDVLLATCPLQKPCGSVDGTTGRLTLLIGPRDEDAAANGNVSYGVFCTADGTERLRVDCVESNTPVDDCLAMPSTTVVVGTPVELLSFTIG